MTTAAVIYLHDVSIGSEITTAKRVDWYIIMQGPDEIIGWLIGQGGGRVVFAYCTCTR